MSYKTLVRKPEVKRLLERPGHRREDNIKMDLKEPGCEGVDWIYLPQGKVWRWISANVIMKVWVP
jgi:hypothetical protein